MSTTLIPAFQKWFKIKSTVNDDTADTTQKLPRDQELTLKKQAETFWQEDFAIYQRNSTRGPKKNEVKWQQTVIKSGALADKIAAHSLMIQASPVHALSSIAALVKIAQSKTKREYLMTIDRIKDLFLADLLPPRKLRYFSQAVVNLPTNEREKKIALILAYFEDQLKYYYKQFIDAVETMSHDTIVATKSSSINVMYKLLSDNPEQEAYLLEKLVNKLGDPVSKTASHVVYLLKKIIIDDHPAMKEVVCKEVERLLFRPNCTERAQYYSMCFLQEVKFTKQDNELANRLMDMYFGFFKKNIQITDINSKLMLAILTGVSRTLPYSTIGRDSVAEHIETLFKIIHVANVNIAIQALSLIFVIAAGKTKDMKRNKIEKSAKNRIDDRYYSALYRFLLRDELETTSRSPMLFNLLYRSLKRDSRNVRVLAFIKRILQISCSVSPQYAAAFLFLVSELAKQRSLTSFYRKKAMNDIELKESDNYDLAARNPLFCNAQKSLGLWELQFLVKHQHPSVALFAQALLDGKSIEYDGDVLNDFSTKNFLDRFVSRNPKKSARVENGDEDDDNSYEVMDDKEVDSDNESSSSEGLEKVLFESDEDDDLSNDALSLDEEDFEEELKELGFSRKKLKAS